MNEPATQRRRTAAVPTLVKVKACSDPSRAEAERFIHDVFARAYGAEVRQFLPFLMGLRDPAGRLLGALGMRHASDGPLFLEHYLDHPVEQTLGDAIGAPVNRAGLVEVGNLAVAAPGGGRWLITALTSYLHAANRQWVVFTCGPALRNAFGRLGIDLVDLGGAEAARLPAEEAELWGDYYAQRPRVVAGRVAQGYAVLSRLFERESTLLALWQGAAQAAERAA